MYKFIKHPQKIDIEEYHLQEGKFLEHLKGEENITSIYQIGEGELPGVSDLDYLIIFKNNISQSNILQFSEKYSLIDTILFLEESKIQDINYISHHYHYNLIYGKNLDLSFDVKNKNINIIYAWRVCFFSLLRNFYYYKYNNTICIKNILSQINDIRYPIFFLENLGIEKEKYTDFLKEFSSYRKNYFSHKNYQELEKFMNRAIDLSWDMVHELNNVLGLEGRGIRKIYGRFPTVFQNYLNKEDYKKRTENKLKYIGKFSRFLYLPVSFDYRKWNASLQEDVSRIQKNNSNFLNFGLEGILLKILLSCKILLDFIVINTLCKIK